MLQTGHWNAYSRQGAPHFLASSLRTCAAYCRCWKSRFFIPSKLYNAEYCPFRFVQLVLIAYKVAVLIQDDFQLQL